MMNKWKFPPPSPRLTPPESSSSSAFSCPSVRTSSPPISGELCVCGIWSEMYLCTGDVSPQREPHRYHLPSIPCSCHHVLSNDARPTTVALKNAWWLFLLCELAAARSQYLMPNRRWTLALEHVCFCALDAGGRIVPRLNDARLGWMLSLSIYAWLKNYTNINYWLCCTCNIINKGGRGFRAENRQNVAFESSVDTSR